MKKFLIIFAAAMSLILLFGACKENEPTVSEDPTPSATPAPTPPPTPTPTPTPTPEPTPQIPENANPFTGLEMDEAYINRRPVVIMINNIKQALPQFGLASADLIYEIVAEGGITRLVAVMKDPSKADVIGSVRSTRSYYLDLAQGHDGLLLHAGASEMAYADIKTRGVTSLDAIKGGYEGPLYYRDDYRRKNNGYEHSLMTTGERIEAVIEKAKFRTEHNDGYSYPMSFDYDVDLAGTKAENISVKFSPYKTATFEYDPEKTTYLVGQYGKKHMDAGIDEQLETKNIVVIYTDISPIKGDAYGRMNVKLVGSGQGIFICNGESVDIKWSKDSYTSPFKYTNTDGTERVFNVGTSYICVVSSSASVTVE